ncbi:CPBP family intramembrane metalloprotease [Adhaeribacter sp. BT258]|uniref:CPBP family intramembrane metalloprotease n=1 Tax=Adhaeribacter terrigena TaxID=2793070 RepID=A0ABS1C5S6_9BACT|nr:CPBP family intramembrane glutamic endopeptidase [Adhaeribacter terrigena]MBK0403910.1 CPBP family intramembrane metalloprotease [Adhaeribacter terrigena]
MAVFKIGFLAVAIIMAKTQGWKGLGGYGLGLKTGWYRHLFSGFFIGLLCFAASFFISVLAGFEKISAVHLISTLARQLPFILLMTAIPSLAEDILTRGYLYAHAGKAVNPLLWIFLSALIYVLNHIWRLQDGTAVLSYLFFLGLVLAFAVVIGKSLWLAFGIHWGSNVAFESFKVFLPTTETSTTNGSTWVLAGTWGALLLVFVIFRFAKKKPEIPLLAPFK